jgi:hypothetical protein
MMNGNTISAHGVTPIWYRITYGALYSSIKFPTRQKRIWNSMEKVYFEEYNMYGGRANSK